MTHNAAHIILQSLTAPTTAKGTRPVWYYLAGVCLLCFALGCYVGSR